MSKFTDKWILWFPPEDKLNHEWVDQQRDMILMQRCVRGMTKKDFDGAVDAIMNEKPYRYVDKGTIIHTGIQAAAILGASKITLVGCERQAAPGKGHAQKRGMWIFYQDVPSKSLEELGPDWVANARRAYEAKYGPEVMRYYFEEGGREDPSGIVARLGTVWLARAFKRHGVRMMRYYFDKGYEEIERSGYTIYGRPKKQV